MTTGPISRPILRTQFFVIQGLSENPEAHLFFNGDEGIAERRALIEAGELDESSAASPSPSPSPSP